MFIACSTAFWKASQTEAAAEKWGPEAEGSTQNNKRGTAASSEQGRGRCTGGTTWMKGLMDGTPSLNCVLNCFRAKAHFSLSSQRPCLWYSPNSSHGSSACAQAQLKLAVWITRAHHGTVFESFPRKPVHLAVSLNSQLHHNTIKAQFERLYRTHHQILDFSRYSPSMGSSPTLSQQTMNNNQGKPCERCNKYLVL